MSAALWVVVSDVGKDALGLLLKGAALAEERNLICCAVLIQKNLSAEGQILLSSAGAQEILHIQADPGDYQCQAPVHRTLVKMIREYGPEAVLFLSSRFFGAVVPAAAAALGTGLTADCTELSWDQDGFLLQSRPTFGGRMQATIRTRTSPAMATVRRGIFPWWEVPFRTTARIRRFSLPELPRPVRVLHCEKLRQECRSLREADVVFAGGAGMGSREQFDRLSRLAALSGGGLAASRGAVAAGFAPYSCQVGQTGVTVRPRLYVAFGISGAVQHLSGMVDAECIVAVNPDKNAPIHQVSDYSVYADAQEVISALLGRLENI